MSVLVLLALVAVIVVATARYKFDPFVVLLAVAVVAGFGLGLPTDEIVDTITEAFGDILGGIGLVIVLGTIIGLILERSGAAIALAEGLIRVGGARFPGLTMSAIGYIVSIPVFCDSGYIILNSLKNALAERMHASVVVLSVALMTGLYATHTFVPPTPGPLAAAANLEIADQLGAIIGLGLIAAAVSAGAALLFAQRFRDVEFELLPAEQADTVAAGAGAGSSSTTSGGGADDASPGGRDDASGGGRAAGGDDGDGTDDDRAAQLREGYGTLPGVTRSLLPILVPIVLICLASVAALPDEPFGDGVVTSALLFVGAPAIALAIGLILAVGLLSGRGKRARFNELVGDGVRVSAPILLITGAGAAFGAVIAASELTEQIGDNLTELGLGLLVPFVIAAALKTAQGSTTVALVTASALMLPLLGDLGLDSNIGRVLTVLAIGAGGMVVSHANDSYFWVVSRMSRIPVETAYKVLTPATGIQGVAGMIVVYVMGLVLL